ncbi:DUF2752 domain-containing protein [Pseudoxanthomonas mexicana]|uniref:DUF2752 domain-containing protein n=1 Tax=Pseudoxanthomonas mexicana TaxID=128785 RepID=UPI00398AA693
MIFRLSQVALWAGIAIAVPAGVWLLWNFDPNAADSFYPPCMFRAFTGWFCIGCGLTRALHALVHGDIIGAFAMNPLAMLALPMMPLLAAQAQGWQPRRLQPLMWVIGEPKLWLFLLPAYWVARNLPWFPFTLLAPT